MGTGAMEVVPIFFQLSADNSIDHCLVADPVTRLPYYYPI